jgi:hypothetical protein
MTRRKDLVYNVVSNHGIENPISFLEIENKVRKIDSEVTSVDVVWAIGRLFEESKINRLLGNEREIIGYYRGE